MQNMKSGKMSKRKPSGKVELPGGFRLCFWIFARMKTVRNDGLAKMSGSGRDK